MIVYTLWFAEYVKQADPTNLYGYWPWFKNRGVLPLEASRLSLCGAQYVGNR
jgi:hypothetical protein